MKRLYDKALIEQIARVYGNERAFLSEFSSALLDIIREGLIRDGQVRLHNFGTFKLNWMKSRQGVNPNTGERITIAGRPRVVFVPAKSLKDRIEPAPPERIALDENGEPLTPIPVVVAAAKNQKESHENIIRVSEAEVQAIVDEALSRSRHINDDKELHFVLADELKQEVSQHEQPLQTEPVSTTDSVAEENVLLEVTAVKVQQTVEDEPAVTDFVSEEIFPADLNEDENFSNEIAATEMPVVDEEIVEAEDSQFANSEQQRIHTEIEELEEIADFLKSEPVSAVGHDNSQPEMKQVETGNDQVSSDEDSSSVWLDHEVLNEINTMAEQAVRKRQQQQHISAKVSLVTDETVDVTESASLNETPAEINYAADSGELDYNLDEMPGADITTTQTSIAAANEANSRKTDSRKPWLAVAASIVVLIAAAIILVNIENSSTQKNAEMAAKSGGPILYSYTIEQPENSQPENTLSESEPEVAQSSPENIAESLVAEAEQPSDSMQPEISSSQIVEEVLQTRSDESVVEEAAPAVIEEENRIVVSAAEYDELQRASSEQEVFFIARDHKLINGDSLWRLAKKHYVNPFYWPHIYQANHRRINNPDKVVIGRVINLPTLYGHPEDLTNKDKYNIGMGYYFNYLYHKQKGNPYAYFSLIGVEKFAPQLLIEYKEEIERSDVDNLAMLTEKF